MSNVFQSAGLKLRRNPAVVFIFLIFSLMLVIGLGTMWEDYTASLQGYLMLPTHKLNDWVPYLVALLPQVGQIGFGFLYMHDTKQRWALLVVALAHVVDLGTNVVYKTPDYTLPMLLLTIVESEIIYTIGSHIMTLVSVGMLIELWPDFSHQIGLLLHDSNQNQPVHPNFQAGPRGQPQQPASLFPNQPPNNHPPRGTRP